MADRLSDRLEHHQYTVWTEFTPLSIKHNAVNLGQGFPGFPAPRFVKDAVKEAVDADENQYSRTSGTVDLVQQLAITYGPKYGREIDPLTEIAVTNGASEALLVAMMGNLNPGDEVVVIEPFFDLYSPQSAMAGAVIVPVPLTPPESGSDVWTLDFDRLEAAFSERTRVFLFNNPHNPVGKCFTRDELQRIADILVKWPEVSIVSDEVYEHLAFDGREHLYLTNFNNLWPRTVTIGSAGKIFSVTGWKIGWAIGGAAAVRKVATARLWTTYCTNTVCQGAVRRALQEASKPYEGFPTYYDWLRREYEKKRDILLDMLARSTRISVKMLNPEGGFFACGYIDEAQIDPEFLENATPDFAFARWMTVKLGVSCIPCSAFYTEAHKEFGTRLVRFALCKDYRDYEAAAKLLIQN